MGTAKILVHHTDTANSTDFSSAFSGQRFGADYRFANPQAVSDRAYYSAGGNYRIDVWYPANSGYNSATPYVVFAK
ncbi:MAG TPA: hypothetical protein VFE14_10880, partial [Micromonosporaceae bacterium]|nr:hypothetical protein [Micromonosporaceae bacterium]